ncbi:DNA polymerase-like protein zeta catalytic subunit [Phyllosticta capitalensis]|uniref:DNA polymerase n=1 Tax=Phyllosticta capitalensis TaxID=121624 RepID=A0ABR1YHY4_9PEZI
MDVFRFRLNCVDHYQATTTKFDPQLHRGLGIPSQREHAFQVPVIRVFGATETGQKVCAHIHGALPYLYLDYDGSLEPDEVDAYVNSLRISIDHALAVSYRRNAYDGKALFVAHISLVKGVPFFGYHVGYKYYLKVYLLNPLHMTRLAELLQQGNILAKVMQPHESHLQYLAQWMCDYNLFGCGYIDCAKLRFRAPVPEWESLSQTTHRWHDRSIPSIHILPDDEFSRQSHCAIEIDVCVQDILNRKEIRERPQHHDFMERFSYLSPDEKLVHSMAGLWKDETKRRKRRMGLTDPSSSPFPPEVLVSMTADPRDTSKGGWIHEEEFRETMMRLVEQEKTKDRDRKISFDGFLKNATGEPNVRTAMESVEDLYPKKLEEYQATQNPIPYELLDDLLPTFDDSLSGLQDGDSAYDSEEDQELPHLPDAEDPSEEWHEDDGEFGSFNEDILHEIDEQQRRLSPHLQRPKKRAKLAHDDVDSLQNGEHAMQSASSSKSSRAKDNFSKRVAFEDNEESAPARNTMHKRPSQETPLSQSSQNSIKAHGVNGANTLSFPVVKNPNDSDTALRLSQRSGWSNSQKSPHTPAKRQDDSNAKESPATPWSHLGSSRTFSGSPVVSSQARELAFQLPESFYQSTDSKILCYGQLPPAADEVSATMLDHGRPPVVYQDAYYSDEKDVPERPREYAGREFKLESTTVPFLPPFDPTGNDPANFGDKPGVVIDRTKEDARHEQRQRQCSLLHWEIAAAPPSFEEVEQWLINEDDKPVPVSEAGGASDNHRRNLGTKQKGNISQVEGPTQKNMHGFKYSQRQKSTSVQHETQYMSIMSLEVHINSRGHLLPDPAEDQISCVFWSIQADVDEIDGPRVGIIALSSQDGIAARIARQVNVQVDYEEEELDLINRVVDIVRNYDPDILTGYEVHNSSWGYLMERARLKFEYDLCDEIARTISHSHGRFGKEADRWGFTHTSTIRVTGRHMINVWRAMRSEFNLLQYTMENVVFHLLHRRIPHYEHQDLTRWYTSEKPRDLAKMLDYFLSRTQLNLDILDANELIPRTSEQARLLGVDFFSVFSRGSQFKVESLMFRIAKPENFILPSPSRKQVGQQNALECLPLVMEPQSAFYNSPVLVLDFQSLYPSVMIAYNYCYSTCLGRIVSWRGTNKMGFTDFKREPRLLELVKDHVNIAPNGIMYVKPEMRKSLLAKMLGEILETRVMVKSGMKVDKDDKTLQQLLNNRQLALKLIANVTYGYTSASFSGRMPCSEIADSIVQTGRETLEKAIALIHSEPRWGAEVVYGDTDSLFVHLKGRTREEAFTIGEEIAAAVTSRNPRPVKLKFEKVYHPCVLLAKKRYVGYKYETRSQKEPEFDAKGIETVRRDGTPAEQKIEEKALKTLFRSADLSQVKSYFQRQCAKIQAGRVSIQDFVFAREVKLGTYSERGVGPAGALIATRRMLADHRAEPQYGERVPYVVVTGAPGARLIDRCVAPEKLLEDDQLELDAEYYITKNLIPPLERIFNLVGANVRAWWDEMPKIQRIRSVTAAAAAAQAGGVEVAPPGPSKKTLENYMKSSSCLLCRSPLPKDPVIPLCVSCASSPHLSLTTLRARLAAAEQRIADIDTVCRSCAGLPFGEEVRCASRDCPVFYSRVREGARGRAMRAGLGSVIRALEEQVDRFMEMEGGGLDW